MRVNHWSNFFAYCITNRIAHLENIVNPTLEKCKFKHNVPFQKFDQDMHIPRPLKQNINELG